MSLSAAEAAKQRHFNESVTFFRRNLLFCLGKEIQVKVRT